ncbi:YtxH domain-containing protein [uncultured Polaribacter sp.]|uniref:YtxH domain-containing protein n=1 Tax=uncultured Polaribacter sp. TaxID=174711 RepID=UPI00261A9AD0|nr:YtxH domain-containing protein [uncultured Polaribacter sp.]
MSKQNTILGILGGAIVGGIAGILLAPDKGEKTREKIAGKAKETKEDVVENVEAVLENLSKKYDVVKKASSEIIDKSKKELSKVKKEIA